MDANAYGGTPPTLWSGGPRPTIWQRLHMTHHDDCGCKSFGYELRIQKLARQIEKLSWMLELMDQEPGINLEGAEYQWQYERASLS